VARPFYETKGQRKNEELIANYVADRWDCNLVRMKSAFPVDYMLRRYSHADEGESLAFAEIKHRQYTLDAIDQMGGLFVSLLKWGNAKNLCGIAACPLLVILRDGADETYWFRTDDFSHDGITFGGRTDRGDPQDCEPLITLRKERFRRL
jgi:hypothetical protein